MKKGLEGNLEGLIDYLDMGCKRLRYSFKGEFQPLVEFGEVGGRRNLDEG